MDQQSSLLKQLIAQPEKLKLLILAGTDILPKQIESVFQCQNLVKLDLSNNHIASLTSRMNFSMLKKLRILYLHDNLFPSLESLKDITTLTQLNYLTLYQNPCGNSTLFRHQVISRLKGLWALDFNTVSDEERYESIIYVTKPYQPNSELTKLSWPIINYFNFEDYKSTNKLMNEEQVLLRFVWKELHKIRSQWAKGSAIITVQRHIRGHQGRKKVQLIKARQQDLENRVRGIIRHWRTFVLNKQDYQNLLLQSYKPKFEKFRARITQIRLENRKKFLQVKAKARIWKMMKIFKMSVDDTVKSLKLHKYQRIFIQTDQIKIFLQVINHIKKVATNRENEDLLFQIAQFQDMVYDPTDFSRPYKFYKSNIHTFRLPYQFQFLDNNYPNYTNPTVMMLAPALCAKVGYTFVNKRGLIVADKRIEVVKDHRFPFLHQYQQSNMLVKRLHPFRLNQTEQQKFISTSQKLQAFQNKEYYQFIEVFIPCLELLREIIKVTWKQNCNVFYDNKQQKYNSNTLFLLYFEYPLMKSAAALKIQRNYRQHLRIKYFKMHPQTIISQLMKDKSIQIMQHWISQLTINHRNGFFKELRFRIKNIISNSLYVQLGAYLNLQRIESKERIKFLEQFNDIYILGDSLALRLNELAFSRGPLRHYQHRPQIKQLLKQKKVIPSWVLEQSNFRIHHEKPVDIFHALHYRSQCSVTSINGVKFMKFDFASEMEAKLRCSILALKTYQFQGCSYLTVFTHEEITSTEKTAWVRHQMAKNNKMFKVVDHLVTTEIRLTPINQNKALYISSQYDRFSHPIQIITKFYSKGSNLNTRGYVNMKKTSKKIHGEIYCGINFSISYWLASPLIDQDTQYSSIEKHLGTFSSNKKVKHYGTDQHLTTDTGVSRLFTRVNLDFTIEQSLEKLTIEDQRPKLGKIHHVISSAKNYNFQANDITMPTQESRQSQYYIQSKFNRKSIIARNKTSILIPIKLDPNTSDSRVTTLSHHKSIEVSRDSEAKNLLRQKRFIEDQHNAHRQRNTDEVKAFKEKIKQNRDTRMLENQLVGGVGLIARQNELFNHKNLKTINLQQKKEIVQSQRRIQKEQTAKKEEYQLRQQLSKDMRAFDYEESIRCKSVNQTTAQQSYPIPPTRISKTKRSESNNTKQTTHQYLHAVFPEEVFPIQRGQNFVLQFL